MWYKLKRFFWCLYVLSTNEPKNESIDNIFHILKEIIPKLDVKLTSGYEIAMLSSDSKSGIVFWNENKYYSWLSNGVLFKNGNIICRWHGYRPSRKTMYDFKEAIKSLRFDKVGTYYIHQLTLSLQKPSVTNDFVSKNDVMNIFSNQYKYKLIKDKLNKK